MLSSERLSRPQTATYTLPHYLRGAASVVKVIQIRVLGLLARLALNAVQVQDETLAHSVQHVALAQVGCTQTPVSDIQLR